jgi:hypothetical protein
MRCRYVLIGLLACPSCSGSTSFPPAATPTSVSPCAPGPTPTPYPPLTPPFTFTVTPDPIWVGVERRSGGLEGPIVPSDGIWTMTVLTTGRLRGSITGIVRVLRDRDTGQTLGKDNESGPFLEPGNTPCRNVDPLLIGGQQRFDYNQDLGFVGRSAVLDTQVTIQDTAGRNWTLSTSTSWELLARPVPRSPVQTIVRQNDPASGCPFDPVHGYGLVLNLSWDPPPGNIPVTNYNAEVVDGAGRRLIPSGVAITPKTSDTIVLCNTHVDSSGEHSATFGVAAGILSSNAVSGWSVATFDFQSCRQAGTPACQ